MCIAISIGFLFATASSRLAAEVGISSASAEPPTSTLRERDSTGVEFWTIEANEGQSAGGHTAIRIDDVVYHVEHRGDGLLADRRDPVAAFERVYRVLGNRSIETLELDLPNAVGTALATELKRRAFERTVQLRRLERSDREAAWLADWWNEGSPEVRVPGLPLASGPDGCATGSLATTRASIAAHFGAGWLPSRASAARVLLADRLHAIAASGSSSGSSSGEAVEGAAATGTGLESGVVEAAQNWIAFDALSRCARPASDRVVVLAYPDSLVANPAWQMDPLRTAAEWHGLRIELESALMRLLESARPDPGMALLLAWGRLAALDRTLDSGVVHRLDPYARATPQPWPTGTPTPWIEAEERRVGATLQVRTRELFDPSIPLERRFAHWEDAAQAVERVRARRRTGRGADGVATRVAQAGGAPEGSRDASGNEAISTLRGEHGTDTPSVVGWPSQRAAYAAGVHPLAADLRPGAPGAWLGVAVRQADLRARAERSRLEDEAGYALFTRNCVTELRDALDYALAQDASTEDLPAEMQADFEAPFDFIPVVSGRVVARHVPHRSRIWRPRIREAGIEERRRTVGRIRTTLEETNTLTSQTYRVGPPDSVFLFFSDEPVVLRPLLGVVNVSVGLGAAVLGIVTSPFDRGRLIGRGLQGVAMSIPELFFFNVRSGRFPLPPVWESAVPPSLHGGT